jgi:hypothetical protein
VATKLRTRQSGFQGTPAGTSPFVNRRALVPPRRSAARPRSLHRNDPRQFLDQEEFAGLLPRIAAALPKRNRLHAPALTRLVLITRRALTATKNAATIGHPTFQDPEAPLRAAQGELKRAKAKVRWYRSQTGPLYDKAFHQAIMAAVSAKVRRDDAAERLNAERTGVSQVQNKRPVKAKDAFKVLFAWDLTNPPYQCSPATIARVLVAGGFEPHGAGIAEYPYRSKLEEKVRQWLKRSRP